MTFKQILAADVGNTFLNVDEFSDTHLINGVLMPAQFDENEQVEREKRDHTFSIYNDGTYINQKLLYVPSTAFGALPASGTRLTCDGREYFVIDALDEYGIYSITVEEVRV